MKGIVIALTIGLLLVGTSAFAADGDLVVNGKVGIGTTSPADVLHVRSGGGGAGVTIDVNTGGASGLLFKAGGNLGTQLLFNVPANGFTFYSGNGAWNNGISQDSNGYVSIGYIGSVGYTLGVNGPVLANGYYAGSDIRWKRNVAPLKNALPAINQLHGITFDWKVGEFKDKKFDTGPQIGLVAQDVEKVFPQLVKTDNAGYKAVSYEKLTAVLVEAIKEQQKRIEALESDVKRLKAK